MTLCSVIIPAARSQQVTQELVDHLHNSTDIELDIVVSTPSFEIERATVVRDDHVGSAASIALALEHTQPETLYVAWLSDETRPTIRCIEAMMSFICHHPTPFIGEFFVGDMGAMAKTRRYARWGMTSRQTINMIGFFDPAFASFYGDVDFSMRCWEAGGSVAICTDSTIKHWGRPDIETNKHRHFEKDHALYLSRWPQYYPT